MPIYGLTTDVAFGQGLPRLGTLHKGEPKPERGPGRDTDYLRVEFGPSFQYMKKVWDALYGERPSLFQNVYIAANTPDEAFENWLEEWKTTLQRRCNGQEIVRQIEASGKYDDTPHPCLRKAGKPCDCKQIGRLRIILPDFIQAVAKELGDKYAFLGTFSLNTTSIIDIKAIYAALSDVYRLRGTVSGIPMILGREKRAVSTIMNGRRVNREMSLVYLRVSGMAITSQIGALGVGQVEYALPAGEAQGESPEPGAPDDDELETNGAEVGASVSPDEADFPF